VAPLIYLDTHVVAWLYAGQLEALPAAARDLIEEHDLLISPMVALELDYLYEINRVSEPAEVVLAALRPRLGLAICDLPFEDVVALSSRHHWTRDPFDRLIVSQAELRAAPLVTKDRAIHDHYRLAVWAQRPAAEDDQAQDANSVE
jgi:PIN domain nuclease of toxin-antitoxin system